MTPTHCGTHPLLLTIAVLMTLMASAAFPVVADDNSARVEAAYLYHLSKFVEWPGLASREIRICVLGSDAVGGLLGDLAGRQIGERTLKVEVGDIADPATCQMLFIGRGDKRLPEMLLRLRGSSVLTVSDTDDFARRGGVVGFYADSGKIKIEINLDTARAAKFRLNAKLLEVARTVSAP